MLKQYLLIGIALLFIGCHSKTKKEKASTTLQEIEIPVYNFEGLQPLLNINDDKVHVINFWATWCAPCLAELPYFEMVNKKHQNEVEVLLVSLDFPKKLESDLKPFIKSHNVTSKVALLDDPNQNEWIPKVDKDWSGAIPATIIYNKNKKTFYEQSFSSYEKLMQEINLFKNQ